MAEDKPQSEAKEQVKKRRQDSRRLNVIVGIVTASAVLLLMWFTITVTDATFFKKGYWIKVKFDQIIGLQEGDLVTFSGMVVGKVKYIQLVDDKGRTRIELTCHIEDKIRRTATGKEETVHISIPEDSFFDITSSSLLGGVALVIERGKSNTPLPYATQPHKVTKFSEGAKPISLVKEIEKSANVIRKTIEKSGPHIESALENVDELTGHASDYMKRVNQGPGLLHDLAYDTKTSAKIRGTVDSIHTFAKKLGEKTTIIDNLDHSMSNIAKITDDLSAGEGFLPYMMSDKSKPLVDKVNVIVDDVGTFSARLAADNSFIAKIQGPEGAALFHDIRQVVGRIRSMSENFENSSAGKFFGDNGALYDDVKDFSESLKDLGRKVTGRGVPEKEQNSIARLLNDKGEIYEDAKVGVKSLRKFMEPLARLETNVIIDHHSYSGQELGVTKVGVKLIPRRSRYFYVGGSFMNADKDGPIVYDVDKEEDGGTIVFFDLQVAQHLRIIDDPGTWRNLVVTGRGGLLEGKLGGGVDVDFLKHFRATVEGRDTHTDHKDFDENIDGMLLRAEVSMSFAKYFRVHVGADNLLEDTDYSVGISIEWKDDDIRSLASVAGTAQ